MTFDEILAKESDALSKLNIDKKYHSKIATYIDEELSKLDKSDIYKIKEFSPVDLNERIQELGRFDELVHKVLNNKDKISGNEMTCFITYRSYMLFVYIKDNCFEKTKAITHNGTITKKICTYLTENPVRAYRNAIAHGNFFYSPKDQEIIYYNRNPANQITEYKLKMKEWNFWQELARGTAYTIYGHILKR